VRTGAHPLNSKMRLDRVRRVAILGLQGFFPLKGQAANGVGSVEYPVAERKRLALLRVFILADHTGITLTNYRIISVRESGFAPSADKLTRNVFQTPGSRQPRP
jgi:hypothetical protein